MFCVCMWCVCIMHKHMEYRDRFSMSSQLIFILYIETGSLSKPGVCLFCPSGWPDSTLDALTLSHVH